MASASRSGNVGHEVVEAVFGDHDVRRAVLRLQADAEVFLADVNARLHREHVARCDGFVPVADVVDVEADEVRSAVHEVLLVGRPRRILLLDVVAIDELEVKRVEAVMRSPTSLW